MWGAEHCPHRELSLVFDGFFLSRFVAACVVVGGPQIDPPVVCEAEGTSETSVAMAPASFDTNPAPDGDGSSSIAERPGVRSPALCQSSVKDRGKKDMFVGNFPGKNIFPRKKTFSWKKACFPAKKFFPGKKINAIFYPIIIPSYGLGRLKPKVDMYRTIGM